MADAGQNLTTLEHHLRLLVEENRAELRALFTSMELLLAREDEGLSTLLTLYLLEHAIADADELGLDLLEIVSPPPGPYFRAAWLYALAYIHPECEWSWERGLICPPEPQVVGSVELTGGRTAEDGEHFILQVRVLDGTPAAGLQLRQRISAGRHTTAMIERMVSGPEPSSCELWVRLRGVDSGQYWRFLIEHMHFDPKPFLLCIPATAGSVVRDG